MDVFLTHVAGVDVHKERLSISVIIGDDKGVGLKRETWECLTYTADLEASAKKLLSLGVKHVAMESTGIYWKPVYNVWVQHGLIITLANASHVKNVPGRKTDKKDSAWLATLHRAGLIKKSYIPAEEFQELRALSRHRRNLVEDLSKVKNRVQSLLEDGNIKLGVALSDVFGVAGLAVLNALANGQTKPEHLASLVKTNVKASKEVVLKSLTHCLREYHLFVLKDLMAQYYYVNGLIESVNNQLDEKMRPKQHIIEALDGIPGIDKTLAQDIVAEATTEMSNFESAKHFAAWAGVASGNNESAGKKKDQNAATEIPTSNDPSCKQRQGQ